MEKQIINQPKAVVQIISTLIFLIEQLRSATPGDKGRTEEKIVPCYIICQFWLEIPLCNGKKWVILELLKMSLCLRITSQPIYAYIA